jgi:hypothetical protein
MLTRINVIPDVPFGTATALAACFAAFIVKAKKLTHHKH